MVNFCAQVKYYLLELCMESRYYHMVSKSLCILGSDAYLHIFPCKEADLADPISRMLLVFGQKAFRATKILKREGALYLQCLCEVVELSDWILDMNWVNWKDSDNYQVVLISAHNVLTCYAVEKGVPVLTHYRNEVSCILYPMLLAKLRFNICIKCKFLDFFMLKIFCSC